MIEAIFAVLFCAISGAIAWWLSTKEPEDREIDLTPPVMPPEPPPAPVPAPIPPPPVETPPIARHRLYLASKECIDREMSPKDRAKDEVGCVESLEGVIYEVFGFFISGHATPLLSTYTLLQEIKVHPRFRRIYEPVPGAIAICATYTSKNLNTPIKNGHCAIVGFKDWMSNQSFGEKAGTWQANFTKESWKERYETRGGYETHYFEPVDK